MQVKRGSTVAGLSVGVLLGAIVCAGAGRAADWPAWRGPAGNGITDDAAWTTNALAGGAKVLWQAELGDGYSAVSTHKGVVYSAGNIDDRDIIFALQADSGKEVWRYTYDCQKGSYPGPRATPVVDGDRVFMLSREGKALCLDAATGAVVWQREVMADTGAENIGWGFASSPVIRDDRVLLNVGTSGLALNKSDGAVLWSSKGKGSYSAAVPYTVGGEVRAAIFSRKSLQGIDSKDGRVLWSFPWETSYDVNAGDPIVFGDRVFISTGYGRGCAVIRVSEGGAMPVWEGKQLASQFGSCVLIDGFIYGIDGNAGNGLLRCLDAETGAERWSENLGFGSLLAADGKLIVLNEKGSLFVAEASPEGYRELARAEEAVPTAGGAKYWTMPVLSNGLLYVRNSKGVVTCIDLRS